MGYAGARSWDALAQGLTGLGTAIAGKRRQKVEDERLKKDRDQQDADRKAKWALELQARGGGLGPRPTTTATIEGTGQQPEAEPLPTDIFAPPARPSTSIGVRPGGTGKVGIAAPKAPSPIAAPAITDPLTYQKPDDKFADVGDIGYVKTQDTLKTEEELAKSDEQERQFRGLGESIYGVKGGDREKAMAAGRMIGMHAGNIDDAYPAEPEQRNPIMGSPEWKENYEWQKKTDAQYRAPDSPTDRGLPTMSDALTSVRNRYRTIDEYGDSSYSKSEDDMYREAQALARTGEWPAPAAPSRRGVPFAKWIEPRLDAAAPPSRPSAGAVTPVATDQDAPPALGITADEDQQDKMNARIDELYAQGMGAEQIKAILQQEGFR